MFLKLLADTVKPKIPTIFLKVMLIFYQKITFKKRVKNNICNIKRIIKI